MKMKKLLSMLLSAAIVTAGILPAGGITAAAETALPAETLPTLPEGALYKHYNRTVLSSENDGFAYYDGAYDQTYLNDIYSGLSSSQKKKMEEAADELLSSLDSNASDLEKVMYVNDMMTATRCYDLTYSKYGAYNFLVEKTSVCQGYAEAFWFLMYKLGIDCKIVSSTKLNHAWNMVCVDGKWYHIDTTWNDPITDIPGRSVHTYFLLSESKMREKKHDADDLELRYEGYASPSTIETSTDFDSAFWTSVRTPIISLNGDYYYIKSYAFTKNEEGTETALFNMGYYYTGLSLWDGRFYYNVKNEIKSCKPDGSDIQSFYTLSDKEAAFGSLYGSYIEGTDLYYYVYDKTPSDESKSTVGKISMKDKAGVTLPGFGDEGSVSVWINGCDVKDDKNTVTIDETACYKTYNCQAEGMFSGGKWVVYVTEKDTDSVDKFVALFDESGKQTSAGKDTMSKAKAVASAKIKDGLVTVTSGKTEGTVQVWLAEVKNKQIVNNESIGVVPRKITVNALVASASPIFAKSGDLKIGNVLAAGKKPLTKLDLPYRVDASSQTSQLVLFGDKKTAYDMDSAFSVTNSNGEVLKINPYSTYAYLYVKKPGKSTVTLKSVQSGKTAKLTVNISNYYKVTVPEGVTVTYKSGSETVTVKNGDYVPDKAKLTITAEGKKLSVNETELKKSAYTVDGAHVVITAE